MGLFDLGVALQSLSTETASVARYARDTYDIHGKALARAEASTFNARCSVQPISGSDLKLLPEALRTSDNKSVWSPVLLEEGDLLTLAAGVFKVFKLIDWAPAGNYCKAIVIKLDESEGD